MSTEKSVIKAWEDKLDIKKEFSVVSQKNDTTGKEGFLLISKNGSVTAAADTLEELEAHAGEPYVDAPVDLTEAVEPTEVDNKSHVDTKAEVADRDDREKGNESGKVEETDEAREKRETAEKEAEAEKARKTAEAEKAKADEKAKANGGK